MTETEAQSFVQDVLRGYWPDWEPADVIYGLWVRKLRKFDYGKAKIAVGEWFSDVNFTSKRPPVNKIIKSLLIQGCFDQVLRRAEPVMAFEVFCEDWQKNKFEGGPPVKRKYSAWSPTLAKLKYRDPHEIEAEAERCRQLFIGWYGGSWVVNRHWMQYFDEGSILI